MNHKTLGYSIRKCSDDEIEIHTSIFDSYVRGLIRTIILSCLLLGSIMDISHGLSPFQNEIRSIKKDFAWAFYPDDILYSLYEEYQPHKYDTDYFKRNPDKYPPMSYAEWKKPNLENIFWKQHKIYLHFIWPFFLLFLFFLPRPRGLRINRKKRAIYWQTFGNSHSIAFVPDSGDPLSGLVYDRFGMYAFGGGERFSLHLHIWNLGSSRGTESYFGIYPTPSPNHNADIIRAIRSYLQEDNPKFLNHIGKRYKTPWFRPTLFFCNVGVLFNIRFKRKRADIALEKALRSWNKYKRKYKERWFSNMQEAQQETNQ